MFCHHPPLIPRVMQFYVELDLRMIETICALRTGEPADAPPHIVSSKVLGEDVYFYSMGNRKVVL